MLKAGIGHGENTCWICCHASVIIMTTVPVIMLRLVGNFTQVFPYYTKLVMLTIKACVGKRKNHLESYLWWGLNLGPFVVNSDALLTELTSHI